MMRRKTKQPIHSAAAGTAATQRPAAGVAKPTAGPAAPVRPGVVWAIDRRDKTPAYRQLVTQIGQAIRGRRLAPDAKLPSENELAATLGLSRMTVHHAYQELQRQGLVRRFRAKGTFVNSEARHAPRKGSLTVMVRSREVWTLSIIEQDYLRGFQQQAAAHGYTTTVAFASSFRQVEQTSLTEGLCVVADHLPQEPFPRCPTVLLAGWPEAEQRVDWVHTDSAEGGKLAAEHLIGLGHRCLGCVLEVYWHGGVRVRVESFKRTMLASGLGVDAQDFPTAEERPAMDLRAYLGRANRPTAVFCPGDALGLRLLSTAQELGLKVPRDLSIVTYDGTYLTEVSTPKLTAVFADRVRAGRRAAELLIGRLDGAVGGRPREVITPVSLRPGGSTAAPLSS